MCDTDESCCLSGSHVEPHECIECEEAWPAGAAHEYCYLGDLEISEEFLVGWPWQ